MSLAINEHRSIDGKREMYTKLKLIVSPGLVNLLILELGFLLLAGYIGLCMWTGLASASDGPGIEFVLGLILIFTVYRSKR